MKDWFKARNIWGAAITALSDEEAGRLAKAIWTYTMSGKVTEIDGAGKGIFAMILLTLGQDEERDSEISAKRSMATASIRSQKSPDDNKGKQNESNDIKSNQMISNDDNKNKNKNIDKESKKENKRRFTPPTLEEVTAYCQERNNGINPQHFLDYYAARGWELKPGQKVKDWRACVRTWESNNKKSEPIKKVVAQNYEQRDYGVVAQQQMDDQTKRILERLKQEGA